MDICSNTSPSSPRPTVTKNGMICLWTLYKDSSPDLLIGFTWIQRTRMPLQGLNSCSLLMPSLQTALETWYKVHCVLYLWQGAEKLLFLRVTSTMVMRWLTKNIFRQKGCNTMSEKKVATPLWRKSTQNPFHPTSGAGYLPKGARTGKVHLR